jgi:hypothetical protein
LFNAADRVARVVRASVMVASLRRRLPVYRWRGLRLRKQQQKLHSCTSNYFGKTATDAYVGDVD